MKCTNVSFNSPMVTMKRDVEAVDLVEGIHAAHAELALPPRVDGRAPDRGAEGGAEVRPEAARLEGAAMARPVPAAGRRTGRGDNRVLAEPRGAGAAAGREELRRGGLRVRAALRRLERAGRGTERGEERLGAVPHHRGVSNDSNYIFPMPVLGCLGTDFCK